MNKQEVNLKSGGRACYFVAKVSDFGNAHRVSPIYFNRERAVLQLNYLKRRTLMIPMQCSKLPAGGACYEQ